MTREPGPPASPLGTRLAAVIAILMLASYPIAYVYARVTHALVNYGSFIMHGNAMSGFGAAITWQDLVFFPCIWLEELVRGM